jgi:SAM-dependent methyltransferase
VTRGVRQIVRFNWPFYAGASIAIAAALLVVGRLPLHAGARITLYSAIGLSAFWIAGSLVASWIVYDESELMRWDWIGRALGWRPGAWINIHAGLDESTPALRAMFGGTRGRVFDIFDPDEMTEPSIARARAYVASGFSQTSWRPASAGPHDAVAPEIADYRSLPVPTGDVDTALLLLSAHELRTDRARAALFGELRRVLGPGGRVIVAEHLRDWANFLAFGPGFLHFHSRRAWTRAFASARFAIQSEFAITPFVRVFVLRRSG